MIRNSTKSTANTITLNPRSTANNKSSFIDAATSIMIATDYSMLPATITGTAANVDLLASDPHPGPDSGTDLDPDPGSYVYVQ